MLRKLLNQILRSTLIAALVTTSIVTIVFAQDAAPTATPATISARQVTGFLPGGEFFKIWLELRPDSIGGEVKLVADWDRDNVNPTEIGFFVLDNAKFLAVLGGGTLRDNNLITATPFSSATSNQLGASFTASDINAYTVVLYNDGSTGAGFTLTATGATLIDGSGQVKDPSTQQSATSVATTEVATTVATAIPTTAPAVTTDTSTTSTTTTQQSAAPASPAIISQEVRGEKMEGELPKQFDQHYLGLEPSERDSSIQLTLSFDPQDNTELARKMNFWVLNDNGFRRFLDGARLSEVAIAAGNRTFGDENNVRFANFTANGTEAMIVVVYNNSETPASYSLTVKGATLLDDAGQTKTAKQQGAVATAEPATVVTTAPATTDTSTTVTTTAPTAAPAQPTQPAPTPAPASNTPQQGSTYTIKSGDSISIIARDVYGDIQLYDEICAYNRIANCNTIEVGDVVQLPLKAQLTSGATAPAAAAPTPTTAPAPAAAAPVTSTAVTTATTPTTTTVAPTPTKAPAVSGGASVTNTQTTTNTTTAKPTPTATKAPVSSTGTTTTTATAASGDIVAVLQANGNFSILVDLLKAAGLEKTLKGPSTFTVFAPTDSAFSTLPAGAVEQLKANPSGQLSTLLLYHVLSGQTLSANITNEQEATTMTGSKITFTVSGRNVKVQDSVIVTKDIKASNGAIHVIDKVMIPPAE